MKKTLTMFVFIILLSLTSCNMFSSNQGDKYNNEDLVSKIPLEEELFVIDQNQKYYESKDLTLWAEINGFYTSIKYFTLDSKNESLRVYDNVYLYEGDYFYMISNDLTDWFADLDETTNPEFVEKEISEGEDYSINILKSGIYKITFDLESKKFSLEFISEIDSPKYVKIKNCEVCEFIASTANYTRMDVNPNNNKELMLCDYKIESGDVLYFFNISHSSNYKVILNDERSKELVSYANKKRQGIKFKTDGTVDIYLNIETYEVRIELNN